MKMALDRADRAAALFLAGSFAFHTWVAVRISPFAVLLIRGGPRRGVRLLRPMIGYPRSGSSSARR